MVGADAHDEKSGKDKGAGDDMEEDHPAEFIEHDLSKTDQLSPSVLHVKTHRVLHPAVGDEIHIAEREEAPAMSHMTVAWAFLESFFHPKTQTPIIVDSRKKAAVASMARSEPKISPTYAEYPDQLVPN